MSYTFSSFAANTNKEANRMTDFKYDRVREQILEASRRIFSKFGFRKATMDEIAKAARKGKSTLYYYFKNKEDVFEAVVHYESNTMKYRLLEVIGTDIPPPEKLKAYIKERIKAFKEFGNFYDALKDDYLKHMEFIEKIREKYDRDELTLIKMILMEGVEQKIFRQDGIDEAAEAILIALK